MATTAKKSSAKKSSENKSAGKKTISKKIEMPIERAGVDWRSLYLYAISLITLLICIFTVINLINRGLDLVLPDSGYVDPYASQNGSKIDPEVLRQANIDQSRRSAIRGITSSLVSLLVTVPVYLYHWRMVRKVNN